MNLIIWKTLLILFILNISKKKKNYNILFYFLQKCINKVIYYKVKIFRFYIVCNFYKLKLI